MGTTEKQDMFGQKGKENGLAELKLESMIGRSVF